MSGAYRFVAFRREMRKLLRSFLCAAGLGTALGGCSFSIPSLTASAPEDTTGSIATAAAPIRLFPELGPEETRRARAALAVALDPQGNGQPVKWENVESGMRGEISPDGPPFVEADEVCRRFTTRVELKAGDEKSASGHACKASADEWVLRRLRPARSS